MLARGTSILTAPVFTRLMTPEQYGIFSLFAVWATLLVLVCSLFSYGAYPVARAQLTEPAWRAFLSNTLMLSTVSFAVFGVLTYLLRGMVAAWLQLPASLLPLLLLYSFFFFASNAYLSALAQEKKQRSYFFLSLFLMLSTIALSVLLVVTMPDKLMARLYGQALPSIIVAVWLYVRMLARGKSFFSWGNWRFALAISLPLIFQTAFYLLPPQSNRLMLTASGYIGIAGIYSLAYTFGALLDDIFSSFNMAWLPTYYEHLNVQRYREAGEQSRQYVITFTLLTAGFLLVSPEIFRLLVDPAFWAGVPMMAMTAVAVYFRFLSSFPLNQAIYAKKTGWTAPISVVALLINIGCNLLLIPRLGGVGAAFSTVLAYIVLFGLLWFTARRAFPLSHPVCGMAWGMAAIFTCAVLCLALPWLWWVRWPLAVVCATLLLRKIIRRKGFF